MKKRGHGLQLMGVSLSVLVSLVFIWGGEALALPSFARQHGIGCSSCHSNWPQLNSFGRAFKESGYTLGDESVKISDYLELDKNIPVSGRLNMRVIDKRTSKTKEGDLTAKDKQLKLRSFHEGEIFFAGKASKNVSFFAELESEDEWADPAGNAPGFQVQFVSGVMGYHINRGVNIHLGLDTPFSADSYNTVHYHNISRKKWIVANKGFLPRDNQFVSISGRPMDKLFYILAYSGNDGILEGNDAKDYSLRIAYDILPDLMLGGFNNSGELYNKIGGMSDKFRRQGIDLHGQFGSLNLSAVYALAKNINSDLKDDSALSIELFYLLEKDGHPWLTPQLIFDQYTLKDDTEDWMDLGLFVSYFVRDNIRTQVGWEGDLDVPDTDPDKEDHKESRLTFVVDIGF